MSGNSYDPVANPYAPGAGTPPPALVGRDGLIGDAVVSMQRIRVGRSAQHLMLTGLRGVGKTVLLGRLAAVAEGEGFRVIRQEAVGGDDTVTSFLRQARRIATELGGGPRAARALRSIDSVALTLAGTGIRLERGDQSRADSDPQRDSLADVVIDLAGAAAERDRAVMIALDEAQALAPDDLGRILAGIHRCGQDGLPLWCVLAGLPNLVGVAAKAATYAERMFRVGSLGPLTPAQVAEAVMVPAEELGVSWTPAAAEAVADRSDGYPFFVQVWAYHTWNAATHEPIAVGDVEAAALPARSALDDAFFAARIARIPESEITYVRGLASLGPGPHRSGEVAAAYGRRTSEVAALRDRLVREGVIYAPRYGWVEFAIPHFDDYVRRNFPPMPASTAEAAGP